MVLFEIVMFWLGYFLLDIKVYGDRIERMFCFSLNIDFDVKVEDEFEEEFEEIIEDIIEDIE